MAVGKTLLVRLLEGGPTKPSCLHIPAAMLLEILVERLRDRERKRDWETYRKHRRCDRATIQSREISRYGTRSRDVWTIYDEVATNAHRSNVSQTVGRRSRASERMSIAASTMMMMADSVQTSREWCDVDQRRLTATKRSVSLIHSLTSINDASVATRRGPDKRQFTGWIDSAPAASPRRQKRFRGHHVLCNDVLYKHFDDVHAREVVVVVVSRGAVDRTSRHE